MKHLIADTVLDYWFGPRPLSPRGCSERMSAWFGGGEDFDYDIERRFGKLVSSARGGSFDDWECRPETCLALIILLDQFPRNLFRGKAGAYASDDRALALSQKLVSSGDIDQLGYAERIFVLMPYQHVESLLVQREGVHLFQGQARQAPGEWRGVLERVAEYAGRHLEVIEQFGRFPHRNELLARESTSEEIAYLKNGGARFG